MTRHITWETFTSHMMQTHSNCESICSFDHILENGMGTAETARQTTI